MYTRIFIAALLAGACAGLLTGLLQLYFVQPVLLHAELYEGRELVHFGNAGSPVAPEVPGFDLVRDLLSIVFTMLTYSAYALIMIGVMSIAEERGAPISGRSGILWGIAGFVAFHFAPGFSLPPEVPGMSAADVSLRQMWWFPTVAATAVALWLLAFGRNWTAWGVAIILLLAPHVIGAPQPDVLTGPAPTELGSLFAARAFGIGFAAWVLLGSFAGFFWQREAASAAQNA